MTRAGMAGAAVSTVLGLVAMSLSGDFATAAQKPALLKLAAGEHLEALIVLGPGLNDSTHAGGIRRRGLPEYLRGWCIVSEEGVTGVTAGAPALLNLTELLLVGVTASGGELSARQWGGEQ